MRLYARLACHCPKLSAVGWIYCFVCFMKEISCGSLSGGSPLSGGGGEFKAAVW